MLSGPFENIRVFEESEFLKGFFPGVFTMASYVKLEELKHPSTIYGYWKGPKLFRFSAVINNKLHFEVRDHKQKKSVFVVDGG